MISPIIPLWLMIPITVVFIVFIAIYNRNVKLITRLLMVILLFVINLRISIPNGEIDVLKNDLDVIFVIDTTLSMDALDYDGDTRLSKVKEDLRYIADKLSGSSFSVITYDSVTTIIPLTSDTNAINSSISTLKTADALYAKGSSITSFKSDLERILESSKKKEDRQRIVFLVTDGENTSDEKVESLTDLKESIDNGAVLGYGTKKGGKIKVETYQGSGKFEYLKDRTSYPYTDAVSVIDEENLNNISKDLGIDYIHMDKQSRIDSKIQEINRMKNYNDETKEYAFQDIYYYFSFFLIVLFVFELIEARRMHQ